MNCSNYGKCYWFCLALLTVETLMLENVDSLRLLLTGSASMHGQKVFRILFLPNKK